VASRRDCERMITDGRVHVNGKLVTALPVFVDPREDRISVDGVPLPGAERTARRVYVMLNKPDNTLGTTRDQLAYEKGGRKTVSDLVKHSSGARLFPVGRLDFHSTGLVLMTNDGALAERLTHARYGVGKTYRVWVANRVTPENLDMLRRRIGQKDATDPEGRPTGGVRIVSDAEEPDDQHRRTRTEPGTTVLEIQARQGKTEPLGEMLTAVGCRVKRIARVAIGPLRLMGVKPGGWRDLTKDELRTLKEAAGLGGDGRERPRGPAHPHRHEPSEAGA
jgi:23S rRNA pseudouridine2605 synthase